MPLGNSAPPPQNGYRPLIQSATSNTDTRVSQAAKKTTNGHQLMANGALSSKSSDEGTAHVNDSSLGSSSHTSDSSDANADQPVTSRLSTSEQAGSGTDQWSLQQDPLDILGIPRSAFTTLVSSRPSSAAGQSTQATPDSARARTTAPQPAIDSRNAQVGMFDPARKDIHRFR